MPNDSNVNVPRFLQDGVARSDWLELVGFCRINHYDNVHTIFNIYNLTLLLDFFNYYFSCEPAIVARGLHLTENLGFILYKSTNKCSLLSV